MQESRDDQQAAQAAGLLYAAPAQDRWTFEDFLRQLGTSFDNTAWGQLAKEICEAEQREQREQYASLHEQINGLMEQLHAQIEDGLAT